MRELDSVTVSAAFLVLTPLFLIVVFMLAVSLFCSSLCLSAVAANAQANANARAEIAERSVSKLSADLVRLDFISQLCIPLFCRTLHNHADLHTSKPTFMNLRMPCLLISYTDMR